jgi:hypothetical protein
MFEQGQKIVRSVISKLYSEGLNAATKSFQELKQSYSTNKDVQPYLSFVEGMLKCFKELDTNHVVVEASLRQNAEWVEKCINSLEEAKNALIISDESKCRIDACVEALKFVRDALAQGKKPLL